MKKTILTILIEKVINQEMYNDYIKQVVQIVNSYGGEYMIRSNNITSFFGDAPKRVIMIAFESMDKAKSCFFSEEYQKIKHLRENSTVSRAFFIENNE